MEDLPKKDPLARAIRPLTIAVWCLAIVGLGQFGIYGYSLYRTSAYFREADGGARRARSQPGGGSDVASDGKSFDSLGPEEKIKRASAILLTKHENANGKLKAVVVEILKQPSDGSLKYAIGDELPEMSHYGGDTATYGEGMVVLFLGSPNHMRESMTYREGRVPGMSDMPLTMIRDLASGKEGHAPDSAQRSPVPIPSTGESVPSGPDGDVLLQTSTDVDGVTREFSIPRSIAVRLPDWLPEEGEPPLPMLKAMQLAAAAAQAQSPGHPSFVARRVALNTMSCGEPVPNRWYYAVDSVPSRNGGLDMTRSVPIVILMDGSVVPGKIRK
jgi:hypothetical protein